MVWQLHFSWGFAALLAGHALCGVVVLVLELSKLFSRPVVTPDPSPSPTPPESPDPARVQASLPIPLHAKEEVKQENATDTKYLPDMYGDTPRVKVIITAGYEILVIANSNLNFPLLVLPVPHLTNVRKLIGEAIALHLVELQWEFEREIARGFGLVLDAPAVLHSTAVEKPTEAPTIYGLCAAHEETRLTELVESAQKNIIVLDVPEVFEQSQVIELPLTFASCPELRVDAGGAQCSQEQGPHFTDEEKLDRYQKVIRRKRSNVGTPRLSLFAGLFELEPALV